MKDEPNPYEAPSVEEIDNDGQPIDDHARRQRHRRVAACRRIRRSNPDRGAIHA